LLGVGLVLLFLGVAALTVIAVASLFVGSNMSTDEAAVGALPAAALALLGALLAVRRRAHRSVR
jgi:MYXO-CTERM domain-containing protein